MKNIVYQLTGYLHSLRRLAKYNSDFWAVHIVIETTIDDAMEKYFEKLRTKTKVVEIRKIDYTRVKEFFDEFIIQNLAIENKDQIDMLLWDIVEYYGIASSQLDSQKFNVLVSEGAYEIRVSSESNFHESLVYFLVPIKNQAILTGLGIRA